MVRNSIATSTVGRMSGNMFDETGATLGRRQRNGHAFFLNDLGLPARRGRLLWSQRGALGTRLTRGSRGPTVALRDLAPVSEDKALSTRTHVPADPRGYKAGGQVRGPVAWHHSHAARRRPRRRRRAPVVRLEAGASSGRRPRWRAVRLDTFEEKMDAQPWFEALYGVSRTRKRGPGRRAERDRSAQGQPLNAALVDNMSVEEAMTEAESQIESFAMRTATEPDRDSR